MSDAYPRGAVAHTPGGIAAAGSDEDQVARTAAARERGGHGQLEGTGEPRGLGWIEGPGGDVESGRATGEGGAAMLLGEELERRKSGLSELIEIMRPAVQMDGGDLEVIDVDYEAGIVEVQLQGACGSCAISSSTLQGGVERLLTERLNWITEVRGGVDESVDPFESASLGRGAYVPRYY